MMINWVNALLPSCEVRNFTSNWSNGCLLLSLINEIKPNKIPGSLDPSTKKSNCLLAIKSAKVHLKVPPIIDPDDLVSEQLDELSMMTYLSYFVKPASRSVLRWVHDIVPQLKINNLSTDWNDGTAFAAVLNTLYPGMIPDWKSFKKTPPDVNIQKIFNVAKEKCGILPNTDASDMASRNVDELIVMTYLLRIRYSSLQCLPENVEVSGPGISEAKLEKHTHIIVDTTKAGAGNLSITGTYHDDCSIALAIKEKSAGVYKVSYQPQKSGNLRFSILLDNMDVPGSPFTVCVKDTSLIRIIDRDSLATTIHVNTDVEIKVDATSIGAGNLNCRLLYPNSPTIVPTVTGEDGIFTASFTASKAGTPRLRFYWDKEEVKTCSISFTILDPRQYQVKKLPEDRKYNTFEAIMFSVESKQGSLPLDPLQMTAICSDIQIPIEFESIDGEEGQAVFTPTLPGVYELEVACIDRLVPGSPFTVTVVDSSRCIMETKPPKYLALGIPFEFMINIDEAGTGELILKCPEEQDLFDYKVNEVELNVRVAVEVTPKKMGEVMVSFFHCGNEIPGCPFRISICDPGLCRISGDTFENRSSLVGNQVEVVVSSSNWSGIKPIVKAQGPTAKYTTTLTVDAFDVYSTQFTPWEVGEHEVSVTLGGYHVPGSPFYFTTAAESSGLCSATGNGLRCALTGVPAQFVILANDSSLVGSRNLSIQVQSVISGDLGMVRIRDNQNGTYSIAYMVKKPGAYLIIVKAWGAHIPGSPFKMNANRGPEAELCSVYGPALNSSDMMRIGDPIDFTVDAASAGEGELYVSAIGSKGVKAQAFIAQTKKDVYDVQIDPLRPGKYRVSVKWGGRHVPNSPFFIKVYPGADASKCKAFGPGLENGLVGRLSAFTIETQNAGSGVLKIRLNGVKDSFKVEVSPRSSEDVRTLLAAYNPTSPGEYLITIKWSEKHIPGSPFKVKIEGDRHRNDHGLLMATPRIQELSTVDEEYTSGSSTGELDDYKTKSIKHPAQQRRRKGARKVNQNTRHDQPDFTKLSTNPRFSQGPKVVSIKGLRHRGLIRTKKHNPKRVSYIDRDQDKQYSSENYSQLHENTDSRKTKKKKKPKDSSKEEIGYNFY